MTPLEIFEKYKIRCEGSGTPGDAYTGSERRCQMCKKHYLHCPEIPNHSRFDVLQALRDGVLDKLSTADAYEIHCLDRTSF